MQVSRFMSGAVPAPVQPTHITNSQQPEVEPYDFGDFGGALSWPTPLSAGEQHEVLKALQLYKESPGNEWAASQTLLEYLNSPLSLTAEQLADPAEALRTLITNAQGQALGLAVQTHLKGISTDASLNDYALAAVQLSLDPLSIDEPQRNSIAGYDLAGQLHWGKPLSAVSGKLREHLVNQLGSTPELAALGAYALLANKAPLFLIRDIPDTVKYGGAAWFNLAIAAAIIEAQSPGKVAKMNFAQVMLDAESAALIDPAVTRYAQTITLIDWAVVQGLVERSADESHTELQLSQFKARFNEQLADRLNTSVLMNSRFPSRKDIARAKLKERFGEKFSIEEAVLEWDRPLWSQGLTVFSPLLNQTFGPTGLHSLLDVAMMDVSWQWKTSDPLLKLHIDEINALDLGVRSTFRNQYETALSNLKEGARLQLQHVISELPLKDRQNLEYGKIDFYQHKTFRLSTGLWGRTLISTNPELVMRVERGFDRNVTVYGIDLVAGAIVKKDTDPAGETDRFDAQAPSIVYCTTLFHPQDQTLATPFKDRPSGEWISPVPDSYASARTRAIADAFVEHLDYDSEDILKAAEGQTTYDKELAVLEARLEFLLNLIPFRSAISNFIEGKYLDGAIDLFLDVLGFVTAGVGAAARLAQVAARTASALGKALKAAKIIGMLVLGELNPLSAVVAGGQLLGQGIKFLATKGLYQFNRLTGAARQYDLLIAASKKYGPAAIGHFKIGEQSVEGVGVLKGGDWFRYDARKGRLYGAPGEFRLSGSGGFGNSELSRLSVKSSEIVGLEPNAQGIMRSADGQRFYIRNIDVTGKKAVYRIRSDFTLSGDLTDVTLVDPATNRAHGTRLWQVAPDQWQATRLRGGNLPASKADVPAGAIIDETSSSANKLVHTSSNPLRLDSMFVRERLPNGLWEPAIETVDNSFLAHLTGDWGEVSYVPYTFQRTSIVQALSPLELSRLSMTASLVQPSRVRYSAEIAAQLQRKEGGASFLFVMERIKPADPLGAEFNALKIHDPKVDKLPEQANAVHGFWAPQGGHVDIPVHPKWGEPDHVFTGDFTGCTLVADQMDANVLRVRHVEGSKELAQYKGLAREEHGWGLSMSMEFHDYGLRIDGSGKADAILTGFAFMKYDREARSWKLYFQSTQGGSTIMRHSTVKPGWGRRPDTLVELRSNTRVTKVVSRPVTTIDGAKAG